MLDPPEITGRALERELILGGALGYTHAYRYRGTPDGLELVQTIAAERAGAIFDGAVLAQDFDGDGIEDLAVLPRGDTGPVSLFLGQPDGGLEVTPHIGQHVPDGARPAGDLDGDGRTDLQVAGPEFLLVGDDIADWSRNAITSRYDSYVPAGDLDGDGFGDVAFTRREPGPVVIFRGGPAGLRAAPWVIDRPEPNFGATVAPVGDLDADGHDDLVVFEAAGTHLRGERAYLYFGGPTGPTAVLIIPRPPDGLLSPSATSRTP